jgi:hypothetical protein
MANPCGCGRLIEIGLRGDSWTLNEKGHHVREMPRAQRRDLKSLRVGPEPALPRRQDPVRRAVPAPMTEPPLVTDLLSLCFADGPPLSPLDLLGRDDLFLPVPADFPTTSTTSNWIFSEDQSVQTGATFWPLFD